jgi:hypothetical protein
VCEDGSRQFQQPAVSTRLLSNTYSLVVAATVTYVTLPFRPYQFHVASQQLFQFHPTT